MEISREVKVWVSTAISRLCHGLGLHSTSSFGNTAKIDGLMNTSKCHMESVSLAAGSFFSTIIIQTHCHSNVSSLVPA